MSPGSAPLWIAICRHNACRSLQISVKPFGFGDVIFICVGTPPLRNGDADLTAMDAAAKLIVTEARTSKLVIEKSTVPAQTGQRLKQALATYARHPSRSSLFESHPIRNFFAKERQSLTFSTPSAL